MKKFALTMIGTAVLAVFLGAASANAAVVSKAVDYSAGGVTLKGYLAYDDAIHGMRPGVLVVHEWWGLNDYVRRRARMLAELGYVALAVDMYGDGKTATHPDDAGKFSSELMKNFPIAKARFLAALDFLRGQPVVDPSRIAAAGYCFGGGVALNMARQGVDLKGVASFHGNLSAVQPAQPGMIKARIIVFNGADDKFNPPEQVEAFKKEMAEAKADFRIIDYPGAVHSFTNPEATELGKKFNLPLAYNADADGKSWEEMKTFLKTIFR